jgi:hypothetical protein
MCAIKIKGNSDYLENISLVFSDRIDKTRKYAVKHNTFVKELSSKKIRLDYGKEYSIKIDLRGKNVIVYIDGKETLNGQIPESEHGGRFALSSKNLILKVKEFTVFNNKKIIFKDDFTQDTIYVPRRRARKVKK